MRTAAVSMLAALGLAVAAIVVAPQSALAAPLPLVRTTPLTQSPTASALGNDVSYPQCGTRLPAAKALAVVGLNNGLANGTNPCFQKQQAWATKQVAGAAIAPAIYVNTGNPGHAASWWPTTNVTQGGIPILNPSGTCTGAEDAACAYVYGYSMAYDDANNRGVANPGSQFWWLDVETINSWSSDTVANTAALSGMTTFFTSIGASVGLYSTHKQWGEIAGVTPADSTLAGLPSWLSAATTQGGAQANCSSAPLTPGGHVTQTQFVTASLDYDVPCRVVTATSAPTVWGTTTAGSVLTAIPGGWQPSTTAVQMQWNRNGAPIAGATFSTYTLQTADLGSTITVTTVGRAAGYLAVTQTSAAFVVPPLYLTATPTPMISGSPAVGALLMATPGSWAPLPVTLGYQWDRNGAPIAGATASTYIPTPEDAGTAITVVVSGSATGYATVTTTSRAMTIATPAPVVPGATVPDWFAHQPQ